MNGRRRRGKHAISDALIFKLGVLEAVHVGTVSILESEVTVPQTTPVCSQVRRGTIISFITPTLRSVNGNIKTKEKQSKLTDMYLRDNIKRYVFNA